VRTRMKMAKKNLRRGTKTMRMAMMMRKTEMKN
jgi:hypothetical protein